MNCCGVFVRGVMNMLDTATAIFLMVMPWAYVAKTFALFLMWWTLTQKTVSTGPLGVRINTSFLLQAIMSLILIALVFYISTRVEVSDIEWPVMTLVLGAATFWPFVAAWGHYRVWLTYRQIARSRRGDEA